MSEHQGWTVDECPDAAGAFTVRRSDGSANGDTDSPVVATVYGEADARKAAAAPDMLAALRAIDARIVGRWDDQDLIAILGPIGTDTGRDVLAIARDAIAKAKVSP